MEKMMYKRLISFSNKYNDLERGNYVAGIYLDLSKAFDTVNHDIPLEKLKFCGIGGQALEWF